MENSSSFAALETMVRQGWFWDRYSEFERLLVKLEEKNVISAVERQDLLELVKLLPLKQGKDK